MKKIIYFCVFVALVAADVCCPYTTVLDSIELASAPVVISMWAILETFLAYCIAKILCTPDEVEAFGFVDFLIFFSGFVFSIYGGILALIVFIISIGLFLNLRKSNRA